MSNVMLTRAEVRERLRIGKKTLQNAIEGVEADGTPIPCGPLPEVRISQRRRFIREDALEKWLAARSSPGAAAA